jgi:hypothetical protein
MTSFLGGNWVSQRLHGLLLTIAGAAAGVFAMPAPSLAEPINYKFSGAMATFSGGTDDITGTFTYDAVTNTESNMMITVTGPQSADSYDLIGTDPPNSGTHAITADNAGRTIEMIAFFENVLGSASDNLTDVQFKFSATNFVSTNTVAGGIEPVSVPAPPLSPVGPALVAGALGLFRLTRRANRRSNHA